MLVQIIVGLMLIVGSGLTIVAQTVGATPILVQFDGVLTSVDADLSSRFAVGQQFSGTYTYQSSTSGPFSTSNTGVYLDAISAMTVTFPNYTASPSFSGGIFIENDQAVGSDFRDSYQIALNISGDSIGIFNANQVNVVLLTQEATPPTVLDTIALTQPLPDPNQFGEHFFRLVFFNEDFTQQRNVLGTFNFVSAVPVPEPASLLLLALGLAGLRLRRRKQTH